MAGLTRPWVRAGVSASGDLTAPAVNSGLTGSTTTRPRSSKHSTWWCPPPPAQSAGPSG